MIEFKFFAGPELAEAELQLPVEQRVAWPIDAIVMYAVNGEGKIVGRMGCMSLKMIEGTYAAPGHPTLAYRMLQQMEAMLKYLGETHSLALTYDEQPEVKDYLSRVGYTRFPVTLMVKDLFSAAEEVA